MKNLICFFLLILILGGCNHSKPKQDESSDREKPNIIFYLSDDQDMLDYGCYGNEKVNTLAVDKLASEGMKFTNAFTSMAMCAPSRSSLYTGKYPLKNGAYANHLPVKPTIKSVTHYLGELGYEVVLVGKSHVGPDDVFDWDVRMPGVENDSGPRKYVPFHKLEAYLETSDKPFCMFIASDYPHGPYFNVDDKGEGDYQMRPIYSFSKESVMSNSGRDYAGYYRSIDEDKKQLQRVVSLVDKTQPENTLFIYSSDHGITGKFTVYDRGLKVPFVARWPGVIKPGTTNNEMVSYVDILPTFIEIAGGNNDVGDFDGKSIFPLMVGKDEPVHDYVYGVSTRQNIRKGYVFPSRSIRSKEYKYIINFNSQEVVAENLTGNKNIDRFLKRGASHFENVPYEELYNIKEDPYELDNIAENDDYEAIKSKLHDSLFEWMKEQGDFLAEEGRMPLLKPTLHPLDEKSKWNNLPESLENTLNQEDFYEGH